MSQLAEDTGGKAFYNTNDLAQAVENAIDSGSNYYTVMYSPSDKSWNGAYRQIRVSLNGGPASAGYRLSYRHGYYTDDARHPAKNAAATASSETIASVTNGDAYGRAAMAHGAPAPEDILFKVRVLPVAGEPEMSIARENQVSPAHPVKPPFRRFAVDLAAVGGDVQLTLGPDGRRLGTVQFDVLLYDNDGNLLNATGRRVDLNLTPEGYKRFLSGVTAHFEISVPVKGGGNFLRVGVHDLTSNRLGVVEVPVASVAGLAPVPAPRAATPNPPAH